MGKIEVTVCAARKLHDCQLIGLPDPFVRLVMGDKKYKTQVVKNSLNPAWGETFRFHIPDEMSTQLRLEVWNKCTYSDDLMGYYTLSLGGLTKGIVKDQWYILEKSKTQAELHVRLLAVDFGALPKQEELWMVTTDINRDPVKRAIEDGTWRPGQKTAPPQPQQQAYALPAPVPQQQPQNLGVQCVTVSPQQVPYVPLLPVQYVPLPQAQYTPQPQPVQYVQQQPPQGYYQPRPPLPQPSYYPPGPPSPLQSGYHQQPPVPSQQVYYTQLPSQCYAPQPQYQY
ncbi:C2 domain containing protein [Leishmania donovani]|uniref:C2_domain_containing_protein_putative/Pfam:PF0016 8 n=1 Tax=Leishmania donovani TaxID=5661 RepID=A0A6J8FMI9_LEIDO|nr:C2 domain containing protein [Leishmania donovani]VDZ47099.1 C2_domain_containing_protein_putative/Pfam:PF00168 [Leishmania donovani]